MISTHVVSSTIERIGYQDGTLYVQFKSGVAYSYEGTPYDIYQMLEKAESVGSTFHRQVKGRYRYTRLDRDPFALPTRNQNARSSQKNWGIHRDLPVSGTV